MDNIQQKTAQTLLQQAEEVTIAGTKYQVPQPTLGTLILVSQEVANTSVVLRSCFFSFGVLLTRLLGTFIPKKLFPIGLFPQPLSNPACAKIKRADIPVFRSVSSAKCLYFLINSICVWFMVFCFRIVVFFHIVGYSLNYNF